MKEEEFRSWLTTHRNLSERTIGSRISNCRTVERHEGDLDSQFDHDQLKELTRRLTYSSRDQVANKPPQHTIPIQGNVYTGTATLRSAVSLYKQFREQEIEGDETVVAAESRPSISNLNKAHFRDFFLQFIREQGVNPGTIFTEGEGVAWFKKTHPDRAAQHIHDQLLKKSTNYPGRIRFIPAPSQRDDLFFALDPKFQTFRLYRKNSDPPPIYKQMVAGAKQSPPIKRRLSRDSEALVPPYSDQSDLALSPGAVLQDRYRIIRKLGAGGMGTVYQAIDQRLNSVVALKKTLTQTAELSRAFEREASLLANLHHPALPVVIDHFRDSSGQFLVMQFIEGDDLATRLEKRGTPFPTSEVVEWADQLLDALDYLHEHEPHIVHRDVKPLNIKLGRRSQAILLDFGLAKGAIGQMATMTAGASVFGYTPVYSPLEQIHGIGTDPRSDIYSLGATIYHLATGVVPVDAPTRYHAIEDGRIDPLRVANEVNPVVTSKLSNVLQKAMAIGRRERWNTANEMRDALRSVASYQPRPLYDVSESIAARSRQDTQERIVFLNNCQNRNHVKLYGGDAFYDLGTTGFQSKLALNLPVGQKCIVASTGEENEIVFKWFSFKSEDVRRDDRGVLCRVFFGNFIKLEQYTKADAARKEPYSAFFDVNGNFKRHSVHTQVSLVTEPGGKRPLRSRTSEKEFFEELRRQSPAEAKVAKRILDWSLEKFTQVNWKGSSFVPVLQYCARFSHNPITVYAVGKTPRVGIKFGRMKRRNGLSEDQRFELLVRLNGIPGVFLSKDSIDRYPNILLSALAKKNALDRFFEAIEWTNQQVKALKQDDNPHLTK